MSASPEWRLEPGLTGEARVRVTEQHTAAHVSSGAVQAFATPALLALMEDAAFRATEALLPAGLTTVGSAVQLRHLAPTPVGAEVVARARLVEVDGRRLVFSIEAFDGVEKVGEATHERYVVDERRFDERLEAKRRKLGI